MFSGASQISNPRRIVGHSSSVIAYQAVSRERAGKAGRTIPIVHLIRRPVGSMNA
jgi:hypothetical protein